MDNLLSLKIVLLGDSGVGKTTILARWMTGKYYQSLKPTVGTNHQRKIVEIEQKNVELFIWDTAGQEQFHSLMPMYARNAAAIILVCSIDDTNSLNSIKEWIKIALESSPSQPALVLAVNKIDKKDDFAFPETKVEEMYPTQFSGIFFVSALTGENIETLFMHAAQQGYKTLNIPFTGTSIQVKNEDESGCC